MRSPENVLLGRSRADSSAPGTKCCPTWMSCCPGWWRRCRSSRPSRLTPSCAWRPRTWPEGWPVDGAEDEDSFGAGDAPSASPPWQPTMSWSAAAPAARAPEPTRHPGGSVIVSRVKSTRDSTASGSSRRPANSAICGRSSSKLLPHGSLQLIEFLQPRHHRHLQDRGGVDRGSRTRTRARHGRFPTPEIACPRAQRRTR